MVLTGPGLLLDREQAKEVTVGSWGDILGTLTKGIEKAQKPRRRSSSDATSSRR